MAEQKKQDTNQLLKVRREKLADLQANGKDPFQITKFDQTHHSLEVKNLYFNNIACMSTDQSFSYRGFVGDFALQAVSLCRTNEL